MAKPYSKDLRTRVVETIHAGATIAEAAGARSSLSAGLYERSTRAGWTNNSSDGRDRELALPAARSQLLVLLAAGARDLL